ncbi:MAG: signal recognition particle-docking protein FtsY [bacterium]|nr:signal recognition particle-docking protein FtsY [bacterium]
MGFFSKLKETLTKTRTALVEKVTELVTGKPKIDAQVLQNLEDILITADFGPTVSEKIIDALKKRVNRGDNQTDRLKVMLKEILIELLPNSSIPSVHVVPYVIVVVGVNGSGKTTTIGKLANYYRNLNKSVLVAAGDTFRAAAIDQLEVWAKRANVNFLSTNEGADPASVAHDAVFSAISKKYDVVLIDTAGRLQAKKNLMAELEKVIRVIKKVLPNAPHEVLLVLDGTTGQNALSQVDIFGKHSGVTGLVVTKLDGTAKGGFVFAIREKFDLPIQWIGTGEKITDLEPFDPKAFVDAVLDEEQ